MKTIILMLLMLPIITIGQVNKIHHIPIGEFNNYNTIESKGKYYIVYYNDKYISLSLYKGLYLSNYKLEDNEFIKCIKIKGINIFMETNIHYYKMDKDNLSWKIKINKKIIKLFNK